MYYSYVEIEYVATSFSPARMDLALKLLRYHIFSTHPPYPYKLFPWARHSMGVDIYNVSIHGWANNAYRSSSCLPLSVHHALPAQRPCSKPLTQQTPCSGRQRIMSSSLRIHGGGRTKGEELILFPSASAGRSS